MPITPSDPFFWRHYEGEIILLCVRWYLSFPLSYRHMATIMAERGLSIHASCIWRWVQIYGPETGEALPSPPALAQRLHWSYFKGTLYLETRTLRCLFNCLFNMRRTVPKNLV